MARQRCPRHRSRGQALAEFALVLPIFLLMLFGIIDLGRVVWATDSLSNAAREGARYASVSGGATWIPGHTVATKDQIKAHTRGFAFAGGTGLTVTVCYSKVDNIASGTVGCSGDTDNGATHDRGALVTVTVTSTVPILTGSLIGMGDFTVSGSSTVLMNN